MDDYSSRCHADFVDLKHAHTRARRADTAARIKLQEAWRVVEHEFGLLAARLVDSSGFLQLVRLDAASADFESNRSTICSEGQKSNEAIFSAVERSVSQGRLRSGNLADH